MHSDVILQRTLLELPLPSGQPAAQRRRIEQAELQLARLHTRRLLAQLQCEEASERICWAALPPCWHRLWHDLSERAMASSAACHFHAGRSVAEQRVAEYFATHLAAALEGADAGPFIAILESIGRAFDDQQRGFRHGAQFLRTDAQGTRVQFPAAAHIGPQLQRIHAYLRAHGTDFPLFSALVVMVALVNCHPFHDGNGRCSRLLFNAVLRIAACLPDGYLPLYELFWRCGCGWEVRMRNAEITGDWHSLCQFMCEMIDLAHSLAHRRRQVACS